MKKYSLKNLALTLPLVGLASILGCATPQNREKVEVTPVYDSDGRRDLTNEFKEAMKTSTGAYISMRSTITTNNVVVPNRVTMPIYRIK
ncbi:MAG: hypothetical protein AABX35_03060 [Nanoarchaeota archaeon]